ncbi:MAG: hypothetical protein WCC53_11685 [Thermoanaerobaculia bacterium]|jgi:hypothetical protein
MLPLRSAAAPLACVLVLEACTSAGLAEEEALLAAGREIRMREAGHTLGDVGRELDLFLNIELPALKEKAKREEDKELTTYRWIWAIGGAGALAFGTSGSLNDPKNRGTQIALTGGTAAIALLGFALYSVRSSSLEECRAFLDRGGGDLAEWGRFNLRPSDEPVAPEVWRAYVDRVHALRSHESCLRLRR